MIFAFVLTLSRFFESLLSCKACASYSLSSARPSEESFSASTLSSAVFSSSGFSTYKSTAIAFQADKNHGV